jgi:hypothetical protein
MYPIPTELYTNLGNNSILHNSILYVVFYKVGK